MSELFSMEICAQAVMDFLAATDVGKFPPRQAEERGQEERGKEKRGQEERGQEKRGQEERGQEERRQEERRQEEREQEECRQEKHKEEERRQEESGQEERESGCLERWSLFSLISFVLLNLLLFMCQRGRWVESGSSAI
jgi:hypothetical protein